MRNHYNLLAILVILLFACTACSSLGDDISNKDGQLPNNESTNATSEIDDRIEEQIEVEQDREELTTPEIEPIIETPVEMPGIFVRDSFDTAPIFSESSEKSEIISWAGYGQNLIYNGEYETLSDELGNSFVWYKVYCGGKRFGWIRGNEVTQTDTSTIPNADNKLIKSIYATSSLFEANINLLHSPDRMIDNNLKTAWCEGVEGQGIGESVTIELNGLCRLSGIRIWPGYQNSDGLYSGNSRPSLLTFGFADGSTQQIKCEDVRKEQVFYFDRDVFTDYLTITIDDVYPGKSYSDTLITEIVLFGNGNTIESTPSENNGADEWSDENGWTTIKTTTLVETIGNASIYRLCLSTYDAFGKLIIEIYDDYLHMNGDSAAAKKINSEEEVNTDYQLEDLQELSNIYEDKGSYIPANNYLHSWKKAHISYFDDEIISISFETNGYLGGASDSYGAYGHTYSLKTGKLLNLADLFSVDEELLLNAVKSSVVLYAERDGRDVSYYESYFESNNYTLDKLQFHISEDGELIISFHKYELSGMTAVNTGIFLGERLEENEHISTQYLTTSDYADIYRSEYEAYISSQVNQYWSYDTVWNTHFVRLLDIDNDGIRELLIANNYFNDARGICEILDYVDGKVVYADSSALQYSKVPAFMDVNKLYVSKNTGEVYCICDMAVDDISVTSECIVKIQSNNGRVTFGVEKEYRYDWLEIEYDWEKWQKEEAKIQSELLTMLAPDYYTISFPDIYNYKTYDRL